MLDMSVLNRLKELRVGTGKPRTLGLPTSLIEKLIETEPLLVRAIDGAHRRKLELVKQFPELVSLDEAELISRLRDGVLNFYAVDDMNPWVPLYAKGPWIITWYGSVVYETGGYGMLGLGHSPDASLEAVGKDVVVANVMTASFSQRKFIDKLRSRIGTSRGKCPYSKFIFMNSGSESMTVALRISDVRAKEMTSPGARYAGRRPVFINMKKGFHGRTERPAQISDSSAEKYKALASFQNLNNTITIEANNIAELEAAYSRADGEGLFVESLIFEPVQGEGNPGVSITPEFYARARELTKAHGSFLIADSIQAGLRAHGVLSVIDYPGFERFESPDMETYSKAVNAAQYPLSVLAMTDAAVAHFKSGIYGNTMTGNPRALEVGSATLDAITPEIVTNIRERGQEFLSKLALLKKEFPQIITGVQGTGLLLSAGLVDSYKVVGVGGVEEYIRINGVSVIHGGKNSLRFTPSFTITSAQIDLIIDVLRETFKNYGKKSGGGVVGAIKKLIPGLGR